MMKHALSILAFMAVSFAVQGSSHFVVNTAHYASIDFMRDDPIIAMGLIAMIIQGVILTFSLERLKPESATIRDGLIVSLAFGLFLASYIVIVEPSKFLVPSVDAWMLIEGTASLVQFAIFGVLLGFIHQRSAAHGSR